MRGVSGVAFVGSLVDGTTTTLVVVCRALPMLSMASPAAVATAFCGGRDGEGERGAARSAAATRAGGVAGRGGGELDRERCGRTSKATLWREALVCC